MEYFAGANTVNGFVSLFDECFSSVERLFILKGSSGCGKSTFMRRVAEKAIEKGLEYDLIYCSGDSNSLDGVVIPSLSVAVVDGTSPHVMDVKHPCVRESIINLGQFWDEDALLPHKCEIISLTDKKSECYKCAYRALSALGDVFELKRSTVLPYANRNALDEAAFNIADKISGAKGKNKSVFSSAFSQDGIKTLSTFGAVETLYRIKGRLKDELMLSLEQIFTERATEMISSRSAVNKAVPDAFYFPRRNILIASGEVAPCKSAVREKTVSTTRFLNVSALNEKRVLLNGLEKLSSALVSEAQNALALSRRYHNDIEGIYIPAMNFKAMDKFTFDFIKRIFA